MSLDRLNYKLFSHCVWGTGPSHRQNIDGKMWVSLQSSAQVMRKWEHDYLHGAESFVESQQVFS